MVSLVGYQGKTKPAPPKAAPMIPTSLKAAAADLDVFFETGGIEIFGTPLRAKGQKYLSELRQAEDDEAKGDRFKIYQEAGMNLKIALSELTNREFCERHNKIVEEYNEKIRKNAEEYNEKARKNHHLPPDYHLDLDETTDCSPYRDKILAAIIDVRASLAKARR
jgi:hypothetical protein